MKSILFAESDSEGSSDKPKGIVANLKNGTGKKLLYLGLVLLGVYLLMHVGSNVHVTSKEMADAFRYTPADIMRKYVGWSILPDVTVTIVDRLTLIDAFLNALFLLVYTIVSVVLPIFCLIFSALMIVYGVFTASWNYLGYGCLCVFLSLICIFFVVLLPIALWLGLLVQSCTPAYAIAWVLLGLPVILLGWGSPAKVIIIIIYLP